MKINFKNMDGCFNVGRIIRAFDLFFEDIGKGLNFDAGRVLGLFWSTEKHEQLHTLLFGFCAI